MNNDHYVSLELAEKLQEAGIEFPKSEKVWVRLWKRQTLTNIEPEWRWDRWYLRRRNYLTLLNTSTGQKYAWKEGLVFDCEYFPAPSFMEIMVRLPRHAVYEIPDDCYPKSGYWRCAKVIFPPTCTGRLNTHVELSLNEDERAATAPDAAALMLLKVRERE